MDKLYWWEKLPIIGLMASQGLYIWRWYSHFEPHPWVIAAAGVFAVAAIDGAMVSTIMGIRQGRRSRASYSAIFITALFGATTALDLYGALGSNISAWLHAGFAATIVCYLLHLAAPMRPAPDVVTQAQHDAQQARALAAKHADDAAQWREAAQRAEADALAARDAANEADALRRRVTQVEAALTRAQAERDAVVVEIGGKAFSWRKAADALGMSEATMRRKLSDGSAVQAAD